MRKYKKTKNRRQSKCANPQPGAFLCHSRTPTHLNTYEAGGNCKTNAPFTYLTFIIIPIRRSEKTTLSGHRDVRRSCWKKLVKDRCTQSNAVNERKRTKPCREVSTCSNGWVMEWGRRGGCCWGGATVLSVGWQIEWQVLLIFFYFLFFHGEQQTVSPLCLHQEIFNKMMSFCDILYSSHSQKSSTSSQFFLHTFTMYIICKTERKLWN